MHNSVSRQLDGGGLRKASGITKIKRQLHATSEIGTHDANNPDVEGSAGHTPSGSPAMKY
jgi:hypothetical protein